LGFILIANINYFSILKTISLTIFLGFSICYICNIIKILEMGRAFEFRKGRKMKRWSAMAKAFTRIGKDIVMAVKEGGPNPDANSRLRAVIQNAKSANMPKENVERAIKKATDKDTANYKEQLFEGYAPHGIALLIETATDNNNRTVANIRSYFNKCNGTMGTQGSVEFMFDHTCNFRIPNTGVDLEEMELEFIDFGVEEIFADEEDGILIYAPFGSFGAIQKELETREIEILSSGFERIPQITKKLTETEIADVEKLIEKIEEDEDVMNVYHTMEESEE
jgi:YebC/PmpR family DNA-binding regulatory protein